MKGICRWLQIAFSVALIWAFLAPAVGAEAAQQEPQSGKIASSYYEIDGAFIRGIAPATQGEKLCKVCMPAGLQAPSGPLATGDQLEGADQSLTVIVTADLNGDGDVTITDLLVLKSHMLGTPLDTNAQVAADINYDKKVTITDFLRIKSYLLGLEQINSGRTEEAREQMLLLSPGQTESWCVTDAVSYISDDSVLAAVDNAGIVTAGETEGTVRIRALDGEGNCLSSALVTVLEEDLSVSTAQNTMRLVMGKTAAVSIRLNHPVQASLTWTSSDEQVATVSDGGVVSGIKPGTAIITAALNNGSAAQVEVTVASPITDVQTERKLYKVKPGLTKKIALIQNPADEEEIYSWSSSDTSIATVSNDGTVTGIDYGTVTVRAEGKYSGLVAECKVKVCDVKQVAITFDDGPSTVTPRLLDFLKENDIRVTFFLVGNRMNEYKSYVIREAAEGHEMGYHSYAHATQTGLSNEKIKSDFEKSNQILKELTGKEFTVWRTPGGNYNSRVLAALDLPHIMWSVDTLDWKHRDSSRVYSSVVNAKDGAIVLMHDLYGSTATGAISAMKQMQEGDYEFVTVTELLSRNGTPPQPGVSYAKAP